MIGLGLRLARAGYDTYGNILTGGGLAALYISTYAAFSFYALIGRSVASITLIAITAAAAALSDRRRAQGMAIMAVSGGFLTPFLVGSGTDAQITLFSYVALLIAGTMVLSRRRDWPFMNLVSYGFTLFTLMAWAEIYYTPAKYLRTELFLTLYCMMFVAILQQTRRSSSGWRDLAVAVLTTAPVLYHFASIGILARHSVALLVYLILFALVGVLWSVRRNAGHIRVFVWVAALLPFLAWAEAHQTTTWILPAIATLVALFGLPLVAQIDRVLRLGQPLGRADLLLLHANALATFFSIWIVLSETRLSWVPRIGLLLALIHAGLARWLHTRDWHAALHALAAAFSLLAAIIAVELDAAWITAAWAAEGATVAWIGLRTRREWFRLAGLALLAVAAGRWIVLSAPETPVSFTLVFNEAFGLGVWIIALLYALARVHARTDADQRQFGRSVAWLLVAASFLTVILLSAQNASYWAVRSATLADATFAQQLTLSLLWAFYAGVLVVIGIRMAYAPIRYAAMVLIGVTVLKVFLVDLSDLEGIYRVLGLVLVGAVLLAVSFLYQRARTRTAATDSPAV
jgi:uncharacterized membrane protein